jgi:hypothetical protein
LAHLAHNHIQYVTCKSASGCNFAYPKRVGAPGRSLGAAW